MVLHCGHSAKFGYVHGGTKQNLNMHSVSQSTEFGNPIGHSIGFYYALWTRE
jgi:hypothetical protein